MVRIIPGENRAAKYSDKWYGLKIETVIAGTLGEAVKLLRWWDVENCIFLCRRRGEGVRAQGLWVEREIA